MFQVLCPWFRVLKSTCIFFTSWNGWVPNPNIWRFFFAKQHHQTKTHLFDPFCGGWTSVFCLVIDLRMPISTNSWIATLRAIKVQVDQSWTKRPEGVFLGWNVALKQHQNLEPTCCADFEAFEVSVRNRKIVEQGELSQEHDHGNNSEAHSSGNGWSTWLREKRKATSLGPTSSEAMFPSLVETVYFISGYFLINLRKLCSIGHRSLLINALEHSNYGSIILWVPRYTVPDALPSGSFFLWCRCYECNSSWLPWLKCALALELQLAMAVCCIRSMLRESYHHRTNGFW